MIQQMKSTISIIKLLILSLLVLSCPLKADEPFDYFNNSWTVIGLKDYAHGTRVTPDNQLIVNDSNKKPSKVSICFGRNLTTLSNQQTKKLMNGWLPIVLFTAKDGQVTYEFTLWATPLPSVNDWQKAFDWPTEGENYLNWILVKVTNTGQTNSEGKLKVEQNAPSNSEVNTFNWSLVKFSLFFIPIRNRSRSV